MRPMRSYFLMNLFGSMANVVIALTVPGARAVDWASLDAWDIITIVYAGVLVSGVGHACFSWSSTRVSSTIATVYVGIQAVFGEIAASLVRPPHTHSAPRLRARE